MHILVEVSEAQDNEKRRKSARCHNEDGEQSAEPEKEEAEAAAEAASDGKDSNAGVEEVEATVGRAERFENAPMENFAAQSARSAEKTAEAAAAAAAAAAESVDKEAMGDTLRTTSECDQSSLNAAEQSASARAPINLIDVLSVLDNRDAPLEAEHVLSYFKYYIFELHTKDAEQVSLVFTPNKKRMCFFFF